MRTASLLILALALSGCALAPLLVERLATMGIGLWGVQQHRDRQKEIEAIRGRVDHMEQAKAMEDIPLP